MMFALCWYSVVVISCVHARENKTNKQTKQADDLLAFTGYDNIMGYV